MTDGQMKTPPVCDQSSTTKRGRRLASDIRPAVLNAAAALFYQKGFATVSVDEIAQLADTHKMSIYRMYGSKDALAIACVDWAGENLAAEWNEIEARCPGRPLDHVAFFFVSLSRQMATPGYTGDALLKLALSFPDERHEVRRRIAIVHSAFLKRLEQAALESQSTEASSLADGLSVLWRGATCPGRTSDELQQHAAMIAQLANRLIKAFS
ncbi:MULTISPECIES: TetR/AcrR family transcriptional regulator [Paraburkholderia]|uniref:TetR/AcrR family transcriptional regulator n=1 Tax=Paraburkholderia TaxID=1822464 RepID=UPI0038BA28F5